MHIRLQNRSDVYIRQGKINTSVKLHVWDVLNIYIHGDIVKTELRSQVLKVDQRMCTTFGIGQYEKVYDFS
jgi:hypothetical protein